MIYIHQILSLIGGLAIAITQALGYPGVVFLMALESMVVPLPSELVLPFSGFLSATGELNFWLVWIASIIGSLIGSLISYWMGAYGGERFVRKFGKYLLLDAADLDWTEDWFRTKGEKVIFIARFIPVVRHLISIPAGIGKMDLKKFSLYTVLGAGCWNLILIWLGYYLGQNWRIIRSYSEYFSLFIAALIIIAGIIFIWRHLKHKHFIKKSQH
ncbi:MAG: DedA family protein [Candidatus Buchananbacteria bacterium]|jgi:membrane protein DedA with SNARE-associated domain